MNTNIFSRLLVSLAVVALSAAMTSQACKPKKGGDDDSASFLTVEGIDGVSKVEDVEGAKKVTISYAKALPKKETNGLSGMANGANAVMPYLKEETDTVGEKVHEVFTVKLAGSGLVFAKKAETDTKITSDSTVAKLAAVGPITTADLATSDLVGNKNFVSASTTSKKGFAFTSLFFDHTKAAGFSLGASASTPAADTNAVGMFCASTIKGMTSDVLTKAISVGTALEADGKTPEATEVTEVKKAKLDDSYKSTCFLAAKNTAVNDWAKSGVTEVKIVFGGIKVPTGQTFYDLLTVSPTLVKSSGFDETAVKKLEDEAKYESGVVLVKVNLIEKF